MDGTLANTRRPIANPEYGRNIRSQQAVNRLRSIKNQGRRDSRDKEHCLSGNNRYDATIAANCVQLSGLADPVDFGLAEGASRPMLWRFEGERGAGHLFGTVHLGPPFITRPPPRALLAMRLNEIYATEVVMDTAAQKAFIMTPPNRRESRLSIVFPNELPASIMTNTRTRILPAKENAVTPGKNENPKSIASMAPIAEPPDIPSI